MKHKNSKATSLFIFLLLLIFLICQDNLFAAKRTKKQDDELPPPRLSPWTIRHHYTVSWEDMGFDFDETNADWRIFYSSPDSYEFQSIIEGYGPSVILKSGIEITAESTGIAKTLREPIDSIFGNGTRFSIQFPNKGDISIQQIVTTFKEFNFVIIETKVTNISNSPIEITKIQSISFPPISGLIKRYPLEKTIVPFNIINGYWIFANEDNTQLLKLSAIDNDYNILFAVCPQGKASSKITIQGEETNWTGAIESEFIPYLTLKPSESISSDPILVSFRNRGYDLLNSSLWGISKLCPLPTNTPIDKAISNCLHIDPNNLSTQYLTKITNLSTSLSLNTIIIPETWEYPIGSAQGNAKTLQKDMKPLIAQLKKNEQLKIGLEFNPWLLQPNDPYSIPVHNQYSIAKFTDIQGINQAKQRWQKILSLGADFYVINPNIPDDILVQLNTTKTEAISLAIKETSSFFQNVPVYPKGSLSVIDNDEMLIQFYSIASSLPSLYNSTTPTNIDTHLLLSKQPITQLLLHSTPNLWIWNNYSQSDEINKKLIQLSTRTKLTITPFDFDSKHPNIWIIKPYSDSKSYSNTLIYCLKPMQPFPASEFSSIMPNSLIWSFPLKKFINANDSLSITQPSYLSLINTSNTPNFIGFENIFLCGLTIVKSIIWDTNKKTLSIQLNAPYNLNTTLWIFSPNPWKVQKIMIEDKQLKNFQQSEDILSLPITTNTSKIDLHFQ